MLRFITSLTLALAAATAAFPAQAASPAVSIVDRDGVKIGYTTTLLVGDAVAIHGTDLHTNEPLDLLIDSRGRVSGMVGHAEVAFTVPMAKRDLIVASLKARASLAATTMPASTLEASLR